MAEDLFQPFERKMRAADLPALAVACFRRDFERLMSGETGLVRESEIEPARVVAELESLEPHAEAGRAALARTAVIKLNGGLATSMGMTRAKSLLEVKPGASFLDVIARQVAHARAHYGCALPLLLMNSFRTRDDSLAALAPHALELEGLPLDFVQHKIPRIDAASRTPAEWPAQPEHEWCPPGHGDLYAAMVTSGALDALRARGIRFAFVSNADNLGATLDVRILGWLASEQVPFAMEVTQRTPADRKGGHLAAQRSDGQLLLRESAQCAADDAQAFQDVDRHRYFNTNNLWLDLDALQHTLDASQGVLPLPMIRNEKPIDPLDASSPKAIQLETAMGAAISLFPAARALCVPRTRFAPVKTTNDLLAVSSDAYQLTADQRVVLHPAREGEPPLVDLDPQHFQRIDQFLERFPHGSPSLLECTSLRVRGDVRFGSGVVVRGNAEVIAPEGERLQVPDGETLGR